MRVGGGGEGEGGGGWAVESARGSDGPPRRKATCWQQSPTPTTCGDRDRLLPRSAARGPKKTSVATVVIFQPIDSGRRRGPRPRRLRRARGVAGRQCEPPD